MTTVGYTHYWYRVELPDGPLPAEPSDAYGRLAFDTIAIIDAATHAGVELADGVAGVGTKPEVSEGRIWFNGARPRSAETFVWPADPHNGQDRRWVTYRWERWAGWCTTKWQPYDAVVCAVLIRARVHYGPSIRVLSDGCWEASATEPSWEAGRRLVVAVFGPDADVNPIGR